MEKALKTVVAKRPRCRRLPFGIPLDSSDKPEPGKRRGARQKFEDRQKSWRERIPGARQVRIELWAEGDLLEKLSGHPNQRGITWFFWSEDIFTPDWCKKRLNVTLQAAGDRYTPELHVDVPVAFSLEGLSHSDLYWSRYLRYRAQVLKLAERLEPRRRTGLGVTPQLRDLARALHTWREVATESVRLPDRLDRQSLLNATNGALDAISTSYPECLTPRGRNSLKSNKGCGTVNRLSDMTCNFLRADFLSWHRSWSRPHRPRPSTALFSLLAMLVKERPICSAIGASKPLRRADPQWFCLVASFPAATCGRRSLPSSEWAILVARHSQEGCKQPRKRPGPPFCCSLTP